MVKNIVMCFDGTKENFGPQPYTNVLKLYRLLDTNSQLCYYQPGIGTSWSFDSMEAGSSVLAMSNWKNLMDGMFAFGLDGHIMAGYLFLMRHYEVGDSIYMFGFSRGAFIARVLAGMLERVGLLNVGLEDLVDMAWKIYESWEFAEQPSQPNYTSTLIEEFNKTFCRGYQIRVHFQGLFDSVNSVGLFRDKLFPCTQRSNIVNHVRHAISIDERRGKFKQLLFTPNPYSPRLFSIEYKSYDRVYLENLFELNNVVRSNHSVNDDTRIVTPSSSGGMSFPSENLELINRINEFISGGSSNNNNNNNSKMVRAVESSINEEEEEENATSMIPITFGCSSSQCTISPDLVEKWFPGDHSDIGGGWVDDDKTMFCFDNVDMNRDLLSNVSLRWMMGEALKNGVRFQPGIVREYSERHPSGSCLRSCRHDYLDLKRTRRQCNNRQLSWYHSIFWWILEWLPLGIRTESVDGKWRNKYIPNLGRPRCIPEYGDLHWSLIWRIKFEEGYRPMNLPLYMRRIILEKLGIELDTVKSVCCPDESGGGSRGSDYDTDEVFSFNKDLLHERIRMINERICEWDEQNWRIVPDDLGELLANDSTL